MGKRQELRQKREKKDRQKEILLLGGILIAAILISAFIIINANKPVGEIKARRIAPTLNRSLSDG